MKVVMSLIGLIFGSIGLFFSISQYVDILKNTKEMVINKKMVVKEMIAPKNFKVILIDEKGKEYKYSSAWCVKYNQFQVGSVHSVKFNIRYIKKWQMDIKWKKFLNILIWIVNDKFYKSR